jgi:hypothetical protein
LESEAVLLILGRCQRGEWQLVGSEAIALEINQTHDSDIPHKPCVTARIFFLMGNWELGMVRFLQQFDQGSGDYTRDREAVLAGITLEDAIAQIKKARE